MAKPKDKQPWFKFFPANWRGNPELRLCSIGARGLWMEMICLMHEAEPYGHLINNGLPVTNRQLAALAGISLNDTMRFMVELESAGVYSRTDDKTVYSRKMVRDKAKAEKAKEWGSSGGNPELIGDVKGGVNPPDKGEDKPRGKKQSSNSNNQQAAEARSLDENGLKQEGALKAVFTAICVGEYRQPPDMKIIATWLLDGIAPATISTTVPPILKRKTDMLSLIYCDAAVREAHAKASAPSLQVVSHQEFIVEGTMEWNVWDRHLRETTGRGSPVTERVNERGVSQRGWYRPKRVPDGFDEQTGERIPPANSEVDAA